MKTILHQLKMRRLALGFKQKDMMMRIGVSRQQYQRLESQGNPRLNTLELIAKGLNSQLMLISQEKLAAVLAVLEAEYSDEKEARSTNKSLADDPWQGLLGDDS